MTTKRLAVLGIWLALAVSSAAAQIDSAPQPAAPITPRMHGPMQLNGLVPGGITASNWSGYAVTGTGFSYANGSWHVPQVSCSVTPNTYSSFWVGIDGFSDKTVEQVGTESDCSGSTPVYYAWFEFFPAPPVVITAMPIKPGDRMSASVTYDGAGLFSIFITDYTTGISFPYSQFVSGAKRTSAEWVAEAPCTGSGCSIILPLADFVRANYGYDYNVLDPDSCNATDSAVSNGNIHDFGTHVTKITMVKGGVSEAVPTALTTDGTSFRVNWKAE